MRKLSCTSAALCLIQMEHVAISKKSIACAECGQTDESRFERPYKPSRLYRQTEDWMLVR